MPVTQPPHSKDLIPSPPRVNPFNTAFYGQAQLDLMVRLDSKRRQLDKEIAAFKAQKHEEYQNYEQMLREYYERTHELPEESEHERRLYEQAYERTEQQGCPRALIAPSSPPQKGHMNDIQAGTPVPIRLPSRPVSALQDTDWTSRSKVNRVGSPGPPEPRSTTRGRLSHEHETELRGVFTPNYLPLLDGTTNGKERRSSSELLEASILSTSESLNVNRGNVAGLSSSAEYHHPPMTSPPAPPARPLSASVPKEELLGNCRSLSSGPDIANRRSSLRNKKEPRSPKRVLFNIDDTVVSPSTSPVAQRSQLTTPTQSLNPASSSGIDDSFQIVKNKQGRITPTNNDLAMPSLLSNSFTGTAASGWKSDISPLQRAYESENKNKHPLLMGGDDFEHIDRDDDVFAFDEELEVKDKAPACEKKDGVDSDREGEGSEVENQDTLIGSSPHAGSLPIEIKWPGRAGNFRGGSP
ncbi:hypothetical protein N7G274_001314 [Stereocaulon virgatum]|uniref:Uncharacterized protein n=1 Tax=Stereocaulon virgatum TaxID=373712 RepID=A0ABR4ANG3_9LECA